MFGIKCDNTDNEHVLSIEIDCQNIIAGQKLLIGAFR